MRIASSRRMHKLVDSIPQQVQRDGPMNVCARVIVTISSHKEGERESRLALLWLVGQVVMSRTNNDLQARGHLRQAAELGHDQVGELLVRRKIQPLRATLEEAVHI